MNPKNSIELCNQSTSSYNRIGRSVALFSVMLLAILMCTFVFCGTEVHADTASDYGYSWPLEGQIFGRGFTAAHDAVDIEAPTGTAVKAAKAGTVYCASTATTAANGFCSTCQFYGAGYHVTIRHNDGKLTMYCHLNSVSTYNGATVQGGQTIGTVGSTGNSTGPHLHFSMYGGVPMNDNNVLDPLEHMSPFSNIRAVDITQNSATLIGTFGAFGPTMVDAGFYLGKDPNNMQKFTEHLNTNGYMADGQPIGEIFYGTAKWYGSLEAGTTYYYRLWIYRDGREYKSAVRSFKTGGTHNHSWGSWKTVQNATCTVSGKQERSCSCGEKQTQTIAATGHSWGSWKTVQSATCTVSGKQERSCSCGEKQTQTIAATGHSWSNWKTVQNATCTVSGKQERSCSCGEKLTQTIAATGHSWGNWKTTKNATCTADGTLSRSCVCGSVENKSVPALGHDRVTVPGKPATCKQSGLTESVVCSRCSFAHTEASIIPQLSHKWGEWVVITAATTETEGLSSRKCLSCEETESHSIAKLPTEEHQHSFSDWSVEKPASCSQEGSEKRTCSCGASETKSIATTEHSYGEWVIQTPATTEKEGVLVNSCCNCNHKLYQSIPKISIPSTTLPSNENKTTTKQPDPTLPTEPTEQPEQENNVNSGVSHDLWMAIIIGAAVVFVSAIASVTLIVLKKKSN